MEILRQKNRPCLIDEHVYQTFKKGQDGFVEEKRKRILKKDNPAKVDMEMM